MKSEPTITDRERKLAVQAALTRCLDTLVNLDVEKCFYELNDRKIELASRLKNEGLNPITNFNYNVEIEIINIVTYHLSD